MKKTALNVFLSSAILFGLGSCKKDKETTEPDFTSTVVIEFDHLAGGRKIQADTEYKTALDQDFTIQELKYYISNIKLVGADGKTFVVPKDESYFLIDAFGENTASIDNVPAGKYDKLIFTLGVDAEKSKAPVEERTGVLDPADNHMYWSWNSGYKFLSFEGISSFAVSHSNPEDKKYRYHIGGYGGYDTETLNNIKIIEVDLTKKGAIELLDKDKESQVHLFVNVDKIFNGETNDQNIDISEITMIMSPTEASAKIANNYTRLFTHDHTHN